MSSHGSPRENQSNLDSESENPLLAEYLDHLRVVRRLSERTVQTYRFALAKFLTQGAPPDLFSTQKYDIQDYIGNLRRQNLAASSIRGALSCLRMFFDYQVYKRRMDNNPARLVVGPKLPKRLPRLLDADTTSKLVSTTLKNDPKSIRNRAILELFYSSGLRLSELVELNILDIDLHAKQAKVTGGKGNKDRIVPIGSYAVEAIQEWLKIRGNTEPNDPVFTGRANARIARRTVQSLIQKAGSTILGLTDVHPHLLRHCFASHVLESSGDLRSVQELLGHENIHTTEIYTHVDLQQLTKIYDESHPRAKRKIDKR